ncbi:Vesicle transport protein SFT2B [Blomia tropicalis]|nr:Vesicle transport protein SFT2B [Blomia tropicalis]
MFLFKTFPSTSQATASKAKKISIIIMNIFKSGNDDNEQQQRQQGLRMPSIPNPLTSTFENVAIPHKSLFPELGLYTRIKLFIGLLILSLLLAILAIAMIAISLKSFAAFYTLSTCSLLFSITFLVGPMEQLKAIVSFTRITATILLLLSIILTLLSALLWHSALLAILFSICQFATFIWYALSYVPYARTIFKHFGGACCSAAV